MSPATLHGLFSCRQSSYSKLPYSALWRPEMFAGRFFVGGDLLPDSTGRLLAGAHRRMALKGLFWEISPPLAAQRACPDDMRRRHYPNGDGFPTPFTSKDRLRPGLQVHHGSQFRRTKDECLVSIPTPTSILRGGISRVSGIGSVPLSIFGISSLTVTLARLLI